MEAKKIGDGVWWVGAVDWDRKLFDSLMMVGGHNSFITACNRSQNCVWKHRDRMEAFKIIFTLMDDMMYSWQV